MFQYFPPDIPNTYYHGLDLYLWLVTIVILLIGCPMFLWKASKKKEIVSTHSLLIAFSIFAFLMMVNKIVFILAYYTPYYTELLGVGYIAVILSIIPLVFTFEKYIVNKSHYIFTAINSIILLLVSSVLIFPQYLETIRSIAMLFGSLPVIIVVLVWVWAIKLSTGALRVKAVWSLVGIALIFTGYMMDSEALIRLNIIPDETSPILFIAGLVIMGMFQLRD